MRKLYEITQAYNNIYDLIDNEEVPFEVVEEALNEIEAELAEKTDNMSSLIKMFEGKIKVYKEEEKRIQERRRVYENKVKGLKDYLLNNLEFAGVNKVEGERFVVRKQRSPQSIIVDEEKLPEEFLIPQPPKADRKMIRERLKSGEKVDGAHFSPESYHIRIQ